MLRTGPLSGATFRQLRGGGGSVAAGCEGAITELCCTSDDNAGVSFASKFGAVTESHALQASACGQG